MSGLEPQQLYYGMPTAFSAPHVYRPFVEKVRDAAGDVPVLSVLADVLPRWPMPRPRSPPMVCDMVGAARQLIAEPEFVVHARRGQDDRSRTCIACNWCIAATGDGAQGCAINPASYRERVGRVQFRKCRATLACRDCRRWAGRPGGGPCQRA